MPRPGDWSCPKCNTVNFASRDFCRDCPSIRRPTNVTPTTSSRAARTTPTAVSLKPGDWSCLLCNTGNFASRSTCFNCRAPKGSTHPTGGGGSPSATVTKKPGDWTCVLCSTNNFASRSTCFNCRAPKGSTHPTGGGGGPSASVSSLSGGGGGSPSVTIAKAGDWACPACTFSNFGSRTHCYSCGSPRAPPSSTSTGGVSPATNGDDDGDQQPNDMMKFFALPSYWSNTSSNSNATALVDTPYFADVATSLWSKFSSVSRGRSVRRVCRIENVALWHGYCAEVQRLVAKYPNQAAPLSPKWSPTTLQILPDSYHINETYLMHGTTPTVGNLIKEGGFDPSYSGESAGAMFGQGTYFSDSLSKVLRYSKGCVVVARVVLGEVAKPPHVNPTEFRRPPQKTSGNVGEEYDSLVAIRTSDEKEFVVYRHTKAYPEYLIFHD